MGTMYVGWRMSGLEGEGLESAIFPSRILVALSKENP